LDSGVFGAICSASWDKIGVVVDSVLGARGSELLATVGLFLEASDTDLVFGVGVEGADKPMSLETGLEFCTGVDCADKKPSLLCAKVEMDEDVEPSGTFSEVRCDGSDVWSGSLDCLLFFPSCKKTSDYRCYVECADRLRDFNPLNIWRFL
jgi:hypothetical protein